MVFGRGGIYGIFIGGRTFGGLGIQGQPGGSSVSGFVNKIFTDSRKYYVLIRDQVCGL